MVYIWVHGRTAYCAVVILQVHHTIFVVRILHIGPQSIVLCKVHQTSKKHNARSQPGQLTQSQPGQLTQSLLTRSQLTQSQPGQLTHSQPTYMDSLLKVSLDSLLKVSLLKISLLKVSLDSLLTVNLHTWIAYSKSA
jgi:hypothetical protein